MADGKPGDGLWGWLGRQVGHVKKAVKSDVTKKAPAKENATPAVNGAKPQAAQPAPEEKSVVYREEKAEEVELPNQPGVVLRRTVIDEVIVDPEKAGQSGDEPKN
jgi:hypothetical protein